MATRYQIAKLAGVSAATVTNVFNNSKNVSDSVRESVLDAAKQLDYQVKNTKAKQGKPYQITLVVNDTSNPHMGQILDGMSEAAEKNNCIISMVEAGYDPDAFCQRLIKSGTDAAFFATYRHDITPQHIQRLRNSGIIIINSWEKFQMDFDEIYLRTVKHLVSLGHRRIVYLSGIALDDPGNIRWKSYIKAVRECGADDDPGLSVDGIYPYETNEQNGYRAMKACLEQNKDFTAVIALNDLIAIGAMCAITEQGLKIPKDISIIGCDDIPVSEFLNPPLTTLHIPAKEIGRRTVYDILGQFEGKNTPTTHLPIDIIFRKSVGSNNK